MRRIWQEDESRPNIVLILTDQWRGDCLSVLGHPTVDTPNLDELAHRGVLFNAAYAACPTCITARANLWTGRSPSRLGWLGFPNRVPWTFETTLPQELKLGGYQTGCIGKTHFYPPIPVWDCPFSISWYPASRVDAPAAKELSRADQVVSFSYISYHQLGTMSIYHRRPANRPVYSISLQRRPAAYS